MKKARILHFDLDFFALGVSICNFFYRYWDYEMYLVYETYLDLKSWVEKN